VGTAKRRLLSLLFACLVVGIALSWLIGTLASRPTSAAAPVFSPDEERIILKAADGLTIRGTFLPGASNTSPGILMLHGVQSSRAQFRRSALWLQTQGFAVLAIDFRGHGESAQAQRSFGVYESRDARAAFDWLKARQAGAKIGVVGASLGGAAALIGDTGPLPADALVLQAVYPDIRNAIRNRIATRTGNAVATLAEPLLSFQAPLRYDRWPNTISPIAVISNFRGPVLIIGGSADHSTPPDETRALARAAGEKVELWMVEGANHREIAAMDSDAYRQRIGAFFKDRLSPPAPSR
jgi:dipeptidyl aminopeptidase/acylaminoacyl peptidase